MTLQHCGAVLAAGTQLLTAWQYAVWDDCSTILAHGCCSRLYDSLERGTAALHARIDPPGRSGALLAAELPCWPHGGFADLMDLLAARGL